MLAFIPASFAHAEEWTYRVRPGDTLWDLSSQYLKPGIRWEQLQTHNHIVNPHQLPPGTRVRFPLAWLARQPAKASVVALEGAAQVTERGGRSVIPVIEGMQLGVGALLQTAPAGSLSLRFADGSQLRLHGDSELRLDRMTRYGKTGMSDTRLRLQRGRIINEVSPQRGIGAHFIVDTPSASTAVRGTAFRVEASETHTDAEVLEGKVAVASGRSNTLLARGYGTRTQKGRSGAPHAVRLLPPPQMDPLPEIFLRGDTALSWAAIEQAAAYRVQVSAREDFATLLIDDSTAAPALALPRLQAGSYFALVRGVDAQGLEGQDSRIRFIVDGDPMPPFAISPQTDAVIREVHPTLHWAQVSDIRQYQVQVATDTAFTAPLAHTGLVSQPETTLKDPSLPAGNYFWRVASVDGEGKPGPFSDAIGFTLRPLAPISDIESTPDQANPRAVSFRWKAGLPGQRYQFQLSRSADFQRIRVDEMLDEPRITLPKLGTGTWYLRARAVEADGQTRPFPPPQQVDIPCRLCGPGVAGAALLILLAL